MFISRSVSIDVRGKGSEGWAVDAVREVEIKCNTCMVWKETWLLSNKDANETKKKNTVEML